MADIIIVGGGISGLYTQYKIMKMSPKTNVLLLDCCPREHLGGRASNVSFYGVNVVTGAGIGRKNKDKLLAQLLRDMEFPINEFKTGHSYPKTMVESYCDVKAVFMMLRKEYTAQSGKNKVVHKTFKEFALPVLGSQLYEQFVTSAGYSDYEKEDIYDTLYNYGFEDNYAGYVGFSVPWKLLVEKLAKTIGSSHIVNDTYVKKIKPTEEGYTVYAETPKGAIKYLCGKVIVATTIDSVMKMLPKETHVLYKHIHGQPFARIYGKFSKKSSELLDTVISDSLVVPGPLQKIFPMNKEKGVYMIAYADNSKAVALKPYIDNDEKNREHFCMLLEQAIGLKQGSLELIAIYSCYWNIGTHYYDALHSQFRNREEFIDAAQQPYPDMLVIGEMISLNQGWTDGALDSVERVLTKKWLAK
jgi:hypothetical protein